MESIERVGMGAGGTTGRGAAFTIRGQSTYSGHVALVGRRGFHIVAVGADEEGMPVWVWVHGPGCNNGESDGRRGQEAKGEMY